MKAINRLELQSLLLAATLCAPTAQAQDVDPNGPQISENTSNIATYLINLGAYLGYNLTQAPQTPISPLVSSTLTQLIPSTSSGGSAQLPFFSQMIQSFFSAIPMTLSSTFVPSDNTTYSTINTFADFTFKPYNNPSTQGSAPTINAAIDQPFPTSGQASSYQQDPVTQAVLNILGTPDYSYCMSSDGSNWTGGDTTTSNTATNSFPTCKYLNQYQVMSNVIGTLPSTYCYYTDTYNLQFINQLNSNTLIGPLMYSVDSSNSNQSSSGGGSGSSNGTSCAIQNQSQLQAPNQLQEAANFIRYVTGAVNPGSLPQLNNYDQLYSKATAPNSSVQSVQAAKMDAQAQLVNYFSKLRTYAAQSSVAYSNFYYIFSKRIPQAPSSSSSNASPTSQALNEFTMATWRLYTPSGATNPTWLNQINQASTASVQKEIATLLAEINYQLYLNRQQQERMLLTENMLLLLNTRTSQPSPPISGSASPSS